MALMRWTRSSVEYWESASMRQRLRTPAVVRSCSHTVRMLSRSVWMAPNSLVKML